jgi:hypothetical protein
MATAYHLVRTATPSTAPARSARWDPNAPGCVGVAHEDGTLCYASLPTASSAPGARHHFQLLVASQPLPMRPGEGPAPLRTPRPANVSTPWALWAFVPGEQGTLLFAHRNSAQLMRTALPDLASAAVGDDSATVATSRVWLCTELDAHQPAALTALCTSNCGTFVAVGRRDGSLCFWQPQSEHERNFTRAEVLPPPATLHAKAHPAPVTAMCCLTGSAPTARVQTALCASAAADQSVCVFDLFAGTQLFALLTPAAGPVSSLHLELVPPHAPAVRRASPRAPSVRLCSPPLSSNLSSPHLRATPGRPCPTDRARRACC